ncbi:phosphorylase b kinase regulatory subunit alpha, skeletal muscle isoform-like isoform X2 [Antedon mediterranea]|uniref:phosphorylase b kinase regulatory subunit alpha, skeletal muscle isoform-like isoform X2 n=1 Tax=Antedon mediterranea TaxID=105859 RepID=UPI003AF784F5
MRSRSNSGVRLDFYNRLVSNTILSHQNPVTGLLPASTNESDAWVRDNVYSIMAVWGLALAYRKQADLDEDRAKAYELEQRVVKLMRGLLMAMMRQGSKLEAFKQTQSPQDSLHAKFSTQTGHTCVGDNEWGHLQIDATSLYLLMLSQMTASGLQIIFSLDEVAFIQNLVFYIQSAYRIPDYGIWERGDKMNHGLPELNASSIGMAKAAMEAINELDLYGARGGAASVIHVQSDHIACCQAILHSMLPKESSSKEIDAGLLSVIGFPAFSCDDESLVNVTRDQIIDKLDGQYGCKRFLRDGYKTPKEDPNRLYYEPAELKIFENIECEWPLFWTYLVLDGVFRGNKELVDKYSEKLDSKLVRLENGIKGVPELYYVPEEKVDLEYKNPHSQKREAGGKMPHMWGQSLYILGCLLKEKFLAPGEIDPLNRRFSTEPKPDLVVQVVLLAENEEIKQALADKNIPVETVSEVSPIQIHPARVLSQLYKRLGRSDKLGLTGCPVQSVGLLSTSKLYVLHDKTLAFVPQFLDQQQFYLALDVNLLVDIFHHDVAYLRYNWREVGRPTLVMTVTHSMFENMQLQSALLATIRKVRTGYFSGVQVLMRSLSDFLSTACVNQLTFLESSAKPDALISTLNDRHPSLNLLSTKVSLTESNWSQKTDRLRKRRMSGTIHQLLQRTRSIDLGESPGNYKSIIQQLDDMNDNDWCPMPFLPSIRKVNPLKPLPRNITDPTLDLISNMTKTASQTKSPVSGIIQQTRLISRTVGLQQQPLLKSPSFNLLPTDNVGNKSPSRKRAASWVQDKQVFQMYEGVNISELLDNLKESTSLYEQADIVHFLYVSKGPNWDTHLNGQAGATVKQLLEELYIKCGYHKAWSLIRHTAGMLGKQVEQLAQAVTDLLVRQKQLSVGLPPEPREVIITAPLSPEELQKIISEACGQDSGSAVLTQELLQYLAMFIRTEPKLFQEMLRLRIGLIIQIMCSELARALSCSAEDAYEQLMALSPFEMKGLLHHILSGREFGVTTVSNASALKERQLSIVTSSKEEIIGMSQLKKEMTMMSKSGDASKLDLSKESIEDEVFSEKSGQWLRRRRLDGALNRAPNDFYPKVWRVLEKCHGISIKGNFLHQSLTREMTAGELKFALAVETVLNRIPQPQYRQLMVEALMVLTLVVENGWFQSLGGTIQVDKLVADANDLFLEDQRIHNGDSMLCCAGRTEAQRYDPLRCSGVAGICSHFYDSAPSGQYGTMTYLAKAVANTLNFRQEFGMNDTAECKLS